MTRNAKPGLPRAVDGAMGAPQRFWGGSVIYNGKKVKIALYLAVFVTRDREGYELYYGTNTFNVDSVKGLYNAAKQTRQAKQNKYTQKQVREFLKKQETYQVDLAF